MKIFTFSTLSVLSLSIVTSGLQASDDESRLDLNTFSPHALTVRTTQEQVTNGSLSFNQLRLRGLRIFTTPFTQADGYGNAPAATPQARRRLPGRTTLQANGAFLRINGLDAQTCFECHSVRSRATLPMQFAVGGSGGITSSIIGGGGASYINANDDENQINAPDGGSTIGARNINGRLINPPFIFGAGGVELLANEMTGDLQSLANGLERSESVSLLTKGISFGQLTRNADGSFDTSLVEGVDANPASPLFLVIRPFGRRGGANTTRAFARNSIQVHQGMQPVEVVGEDVDGDNDGVVNEILVGELSALSIFKVSLERPYQSRVRGSARRGQRLFSEVGCAECHVPRLETDSRRLNLRFPEIANDPSANIYYNIDLSRSPTKFRRNRQGGVSVDLYADLKRHNMGPALAEFDGSAVFTTARLWGLADSAPYLHDGRAFTVRQAIDMHGQAGSEAETSVTAFNDLSSAEQRSLLDFLGTLRTPRRVAANLVEREDEDEEDDD